MKLSELRNLVRDAQDTEPKPDMDLVRLWQNELTGSAVHQLRTMWMHGHEICASIAEGAVRAGADPVEVEKAYWEARDRFIRSSDITPPGQTDPQCETSPEPSETHPGSLQSSRRPESCPAPDSSEVASKTR